METDEENQNYNDSKDDLDNLVAGSVVGNENYSNTDGTNHGNYDMSALLTADSAAHSIGYNPTSSNLGVSGALGTLGSPLPTTQVLEQMVIWRMESFWSHHLPLRSLTFAGQEHRRMLTRYWQNVSIYQAIMERI